MAVIDIQDENLTKEREAVESLKSSINTLVADIENRIAELGTAWQDEKSESYLSTINSQMADLKTANKSAGEAADNYFTEIQNQVKVYSGQ